MTDRLDVDRMIAAINAKFRSGNFQFASAPDTCIIFERAVGVVGIVCGFCGAISFNPHDIEHRYCARCHLFHDAVEVARTLAAAGGTHDCGDWVTGRDDCAVCGRKL